MVTVAELLEAHGASWKLTLLAGAAALANAHQRAAHPEARASRWPATCRRSTPSASRCIGNTELGYLATLDAAAAKRAVERRLSASASRA